MGVNITLSVLQNILSRVFNKIIVAGTLRMFMSSTEITTTLPQMFNLFRPLGLRHMLVLVLNNNNEVRKYNSAFENN